MLGKLIQRLRRPGIVYCATVRAVDELYVALRHGKIPVERYNGKMTTDEREKAQASFMASGRKVVMIATNAFGLGIDKPDIRYIIHYQMPGSPESYVQEAGRAGRDGKPARCVLLFQPDDIAIQEHFLKEAHPTKSQARMVAEGLYAWSDEGKEVSVRDLAMSLALPERRVRVVLSVLEGMGVAEEVKAARWKGVEPRPTREQIDKAAIGVRGPADLRSAAAGRPAEVHEHAALPGADDARVLRRADRASAAACAIPAPAWTARCSIPGAADQRHDLHAATDFHARKRRRKRGEQAGAGAGAGRRTGAGASAPPVACSTTAIPELLPPLPPVVVGAAARERGARSTRACWVETPEAGSRLAGDVVRRTAGRGRRSWAAAWRATAAGRRPRRADADADALRRRGLPVQLGCGAGRQHPTLRRVVAEQGRSRCRPCPAGPAPASSGRSQRASRSRRTGSNGAGGKRRWAAAAAAAAAAVATAAGQQAPAARPASGRRDGRRRAREPASRDRSNEPRGPAAARACTSPAATRALGRRGRRLLESAPAAPRPVSRSSWLAPLLAALRPRRRAGRLAAAGAARGRPALGRGHPGRRAVRVRGSRAAGHAGRLRGGDRRRRWRASWGCGPEFVQNDWSPLVPTLERGTIDIVLNGLEVTEARAAADPLLPALLRVRRAADGARGRRPDPRPGRACAATGWARWPTRLAWDLLGAAGAERVPYEGVGGALPRSAGRAAGRGADGRHHRRPLRAPAGLQRGRRRGRRAVRHRPARRRTRRWPRPSTGRWRGCWPAASCAGSSRAGGWTARGRPGWRAATGRRRGAAPRGAAAHAGGPADRRPRAGCSCRARA